jgi:hypothetical protein
MHTNGHESQADLRRPRAQAAGLVVTPKAFASRNLPKAFLIDLTTIRVASCALKFAQLPLRSPLPSQLYLLCRSPGRSIRGSHWVTKTGPRSRAAN